MCPHACPLSRWEFDSRIAYTHAYIRLCTRIHRRNVERKRNGDVPQSYGTIISTVRSFSFSSKSRNLNVIGIFNRLFLPKGCSLSNLLAVFQPGFLPFPLEEISRFECHFQTRDNSSFYRVDEVDLSERLVKIEVILGIEIIRPVKNNARKEYSPAAPTRQSCSTRFIQQS